MSHYDKRDPLFFLKPKQKFNNNLAIFRIQISRRFIRKNYLRIRNQRSCQAQTLFLSTRQIIGFLVDLSRETHGRQNFLSLSLTFFFRNSANHQRQHYIFKTGVAAIQKKLLKYKAKFLVTKIIQILGRKFSGIDIIYYQGTAGGSIQRSQDRKSTRLNSSHQIISYAVFCLKKKKYSNAS